MNQQEENTEQVNELYDLCERFLNDQLDDKQLKRLESLVVEQKWARKLYVEYMQMHAGLYWQSAGEAEEFSLTSLISESYQDGKAVAGADLSKENKGNSPEEGKVIAGPWSWKKTAAVAAILIGGVFLGWGVAERITAEPVIASLVRATNCSWRSGDLPTEEGAKLGPGRLRLQEGMARLRFASGAEVTLEAPVDFELISPMLCRLHRGTVVANVPEQAKGFSIDTQTARLVDYGTEFGVHVGDSGEGTNVLVFDGIVDVEQKESGTIKRLTTGNGTKVDDSVFEMTESDPLELQVGNASALLEERLGGRRSVNLTTADGRGEDAYIQSHDSDVHTSEIMLLVKNSEVFDKGLGYSRNVYLRFDLSNLPTDAKISGAELVLEILRSNFGYASFVPDAEFVVYGVSTDDWDRASLDWENAPANNQTGGTADESLAARLGSFMIPQGIYSGQGSVKEDSLAEFLQQERDRDGMATLLLVRKTGEIRRGSGLVHAFASKRHPSASPPTLRIEFAE